MTVFCLRTVSIDDVKRAACEVFAVRMEELDCARRAREVARPRQVAMYLAKQMTQRSLPEIGRRFGGRDHTTVIHAVRVVTQLCRADPEFATLVELARAAVHPTLAKIRPMLAEDIGLGGRRMIAADIGLAA